MIIDFMAILDVEFSRERYKIKRLRLKRLTVVKWNYKIWRIGAVSIFYVKNHLNLSDFFSLKNTNLGAYFL